MAEAQNNRKPQHDPDDQRFLEQVHRQEQRRLQARRDQQRSLWFGFGMFGLVGWSVAVPAVLGIAVGAWIDAKWPSQYSWTLMGLAIGTALGCLNAWFWIKRESENHRNDNLH